MKIDTFIAIDWSAKSGLSSKKPTKDAIWAARSSVETEAPETSYFRSREECFINLESEILYSLEDGKSILIGFDFAFGYPSGYLKVLDIDNGWRSLVDLYSNMIVDEDNVNNRFEVANSINRILGGKGLGPLWGHPAGREYSDLKPKKPVFPFVSKFGNIEEFRSVDKNLLSKGLQPIWKICYTASVGGQTLVGLPFLNKLIKHDRFGEHVLVWPFDTGFVDRPLPDDGMGKVLVVEIWPGIMPI